MTDISVLIPTRGNSETLRQCVLNLREFAADSSRIEYVIRCDTDDFETQAAVQSSLASGLLLQDYTKVVVGPRYGGWHTNQMFYNEAAAVASGEWLFLYNDDALLETRGWDTVVTSAPKQRVLATQMWMLGKNEPHVWYAEGRTFQNAFPILHRDLYEAMGHFTMHRHADVYVELLLRPLKLQVPVDVVIRHTPTTSLRASSWRELLRNPDLHEELRQTTERVKEALDE